MDDWWYEGGTDTPFDAKSDDHMCVKELKGKPNLFPVGIPQLPAEIGYTLYGPFFCPDTPYASRFEMINSTDGDNANPAPDAAEAFYTALFAGQRSRGVRMTGYEVDFLKDQTGWFSAFVGEHDGVRRVVRRVVWRVVQWVVRWYGGWYDGWYGGWFSAFVGERDGYGGWYGGWYGG